MEHDVSSLMGLAPLLAGPGAGVIICLLVGYVLYRVVVHIWTPIVSRAIDRHLCQIDQLIETQRVESAAITSALRSIEQGLQSIDRRLVLIESERAAKQ